MFKSKNNEGREIINELAIQETPVDDSAMVSVSLKMGEEKIQYVVKREVVFYKNKDSFSRGNDIFKVTEISDKYGMKAISYPEWFVEKHFIPKDLRGFFFFDGEKMDEYFEDTSKVKQNVQKIAQIDILQNSIDTLDSTIRAISSDINKQQPDNVVDLDIIEEKKTEVSYLETKKQETEEEIEELELEIKKIDQYLRDNSDKIVSEIQNKRALLEKERKDAIKYQLENKNAINSLVADCAPVLLSIQALTYSERLIDEETQKGVLPPNIKDVFLKDLLDKKKCICGRDLVEGSECRHNVEQLLEQLMPSDISLEATQGRYVIQNMLKKKDFVVKYRNLLEKREEYREKISDLADKIEAESNKLSNYNVETIREKEEERNRKVKSLNQLNVRKGTIGNKIITLENEIGKLEEEYKKNCISNGNIIYLTNQKEFAEKMRDQFKIVKESILDDVRRQLEEKTRNYFFSMIWKKDAFSDVHIRDLGSQYKISVLSEYGNECLGDLSAGERQVLALSFTAALYSVSGYSVPVIIDTPLGRISGAPRDNIASSLPNYLSETQVVMLATDTEYTDTVRQKLKVSVGEEYRIKHNVETKTSEVVDYE